MVVCLPAPPLPAFPRSRWLRCHAEDSSTAIWPHPYGSTAAIGVSTTGLPADLLQPLQAAAGPMLQGSPDIGSRISPATSPVLSWRLQQPRRPPVILRNPGAWSIHIDSIDSDSPAPLELRPSGPRLRRIPAVPAPLRAYRQPHIHTYVCMDIQVSSHRSPVAPGRSGGHTNPAPEATPPNVCMS